MLITNFSNQSGNISFSQTGGTGTTDCSIVAPTCPTVGFHVESVGVPNAGAVIDLPISVDCDVDGWVFLRHDDVATAGGLLTPTATVNITTNGETAGNNIYGYENNGGTWNSYWSSQNIPSNTNFSFTMYEMDNVTATSFGVEMCDVNSGSDMSYTIVDDNCGTTIATGTWGASDGSNSGSAGPNGNPTSGGCSFVSFAPGQVSGSAVYTCPTCPAGSFVTTDYGFAYFNPAQAGPGTYDITYCFDNGCGCSGCQTEQITVVNPYDASFTYSASSYCQYDADPTASITGDVGGSFTSTPGGLSLNSASGAIDVSASTPGTYTVSYTVGSGAIDYSGSCNDVVDATVIIGATPTANAGSNAVVSCANPTTTLTGAGSGTYSWVASCGGNITSGSGNATPTVDAAGTYTLTVTNADGCIDSDIVTVSEDVTPPTAGSSAAGIIDCNNTTTTVTGSGGGTYAWVASGGGNITSGA